MVYGGEVSIDAPVLGYRCGTTASCAAFPTLAPGRVLERYEGKEAWSPHKQVMHPVRTIGAVFCSDSSRKDKSMGSISSFRADLMGVTSWML